MSSGFVQRGGLWVVAQMLLLVLLIAIAPMTRGGGDDRFLVILGTALMVVGAAIGIAGFISLGRNLTPFPSPRDGSRLVTSGIYRLIRHPLYTALIVGSFGWSFVWRSAIALLLSFAVALFFDSKARREEELLKQKFPEYQTYQKRSRRLVPWVY